MNCCCAGRGRDEPAVGRLGCLVTTPCRPGPPPMLNDQPPPAVAPTPTGDPITPLSPARRQSHRRLRRKPAVVADRAEVHAFILSQRGYRQHAGRPRKGSTESSLIRLVMDRFAVSRATAKRHIHDARERERQVQAQVDLGTAGLGRGLAAGFAQAYRPDQPARSGPVPTAQKPVRSAAGSVNQVAATGPVASDGASALQAAQPSALPPLVSAPASRAMPAAGPTHPLAPYQRGREMGSSPPSKSAHGPRQGALSLTGQELSATPPIGNQAPADAGLIGQTSRGPVAVHPATMGISGRGLDAIGLVASPVRAAPSTPTPGCTAPPLARHPPPPGVASDPVPSLSAEAAVLEEQLQAMLTCTGDAERNPSLRPLMQALLSEVRRLQRGR